MKRALQVDFIIKICNWFGPFYSYKILSEPPTPMAGGSDNITRFYRIPQGCSKAMAVVGGGVLVGSGTNMIILFGGIRWPLKDFYIQTESHLPLLARGLR